MSPNTHAEILATYPVPHDSETAARIAAAFRARFPRAEVNIHEDADETGTLVSIVITRTRALAHAACTVREFALNAGGIHASDAWVDDYFNRA